jgi:hypothetical protein
MNPDSISNTDPVLAADLVTNLSLVPDPVMNKRIRNRLRIRLQLLIRGAIRKQLDEPRVEEKIRC